MQIFNMFCTECGTQNQSIAQFCKNCGKELPKQYASFALRLGAYCADILGLIIFAVCLGFVVGIFDPESTIFDFYFIDFFIWVLYSTIFLYFSSATPGKKIYGLTVKSEYTGKITFLTAFLRSILQPISTLFFGAGYWNMDKNEKKQAWHDNTVHTVVIKEKEVNYIIPIFISILGVITYILLKIMTET